MKEVKFLRKDKHIISFKIYTKIHYAQQQRSHTQVFTCKTTTQIIFYLRFWQYIFTCDVPNQCKRLFVVQILFQFYINYCNDTDEELIYTKFHHDNLEEITKILLKHYEIGCKWFVLIIKFSFLSNSKRRKVSIKI